MIYKVTVTTFIDQVKRVWCVKRYVSSYLQITLRNIMDACLYPSDSRRKVFQLF